VELPGLGDGEDLVEFIQYRREDGKDDPAIRTEIEALAATAKTEASGLVIVSAGELVRTYPHRRPMLIDGLLRQGETMNVIAAPKVGKSWLTLGLAFAVATGRPWLSTFPTRRGKVLVIDNELHRETIAHRLRTLASAMNWPIEDIADRIDVVALRGCLEDLHSLGAGLKKIERGRYALSIIDAWYRTLPRGTDENDNGTMAALYNELDGYSDTIDTSFANVHHSSKGDQSGKSVTDIGAGAGAQSRATDTHLVLRPHEEENVVVLDAAVRSCPPVKPICLRWEFPRWTAALDLDPEALRVSKSRRRKSEEESVKEPAWTAKRFADTFGRAEPRPRDAILEDARLAGLSDRKAESLLKSALALSYLFDWKEGSASSRTLIATAMYGVTEKVNGCS
jgi:hypothetical protein